MPFKQIPIIIAFLFTLFAAATTADAAGIEQIGDCMIYEGTTPGAFNVNCDPGSDNVMVTYTSRNIKSVQHAKFENEDLSGHLAKSVQHSTAGGRMTKVGYSCPGYYVTRTYDGSGAMVGKIIIYVPSSALGNTSACTDTINPPSQGTVTPKPTYPTHPNPTINAANDAATTAPIKNPAYKAPSTADLDPVIVPPACEGESANNPGMAYKGTQSANGYTVNFYQPCEDNTWFVKTDPYNTCSSVETAVRNAGSSYFLTHNMATLKAETHNGVDYCRVVMNDEISNSGSSEPYFICPEGYKAAVGGQCVLEGYIDEISHSCGGSQCISYFGSDYSHQRQSLVEDNTIEPEPEEPEEPTDPGEQPDPEEITLIEGGMILYACKVPDTSTYELKLKIKDFSGNIFPIKSANGGNEWMDQSMENYVVGENKGDLIIDINNDPNVTFQMYSISGGHEFTSNTLTGSQILASAECGSGSGSISETEETPTSPSEPTKPDCYCEKLDNFGAGLGFLCCVWDCPGLDEIISDFKGFLSNDLVGTATAPQVPEFDPPQIPNIFDVLNDVDKRQPEPITHENPPGLEDAGFTADDVKMNADEIQFREDPTGGFNITNPMDSLPEDGSTAPKPDNGTVNYPSTGSGNGSSTSGTVNYPKSPGGTATPPSTDGTATQPSTGGNIPYPTGD